ncbi:MAG: hypothetical protein KDK37_11800 [Leptospiraceae bacterium]|nr:hypothetical protein [Leptospiraceae bacterium]
MDIEKAHGIKKTRLEIDAAHYLESRTQLVTPPEGFLTPRVGAALKRALVLNDNGTERAVDLRGALLFVKEKVGVTLPQFADENQRILLEVVARALDCGMPLRRQQDLFEAAGLCGEQLSPPQIDARGLVFFSEKADDMEKIIVYKVSLRFEDMSMDCAALR